MSGIRGKGRRGYTLIPNWRWEDPTLDPHELRIAGWLASHADQYVAAHVTRNEIARKTGVSQGKVSGALAHMEEIGLVQCEVVPDDRSGRRLLITFDFDAWEARSPDDQGGHDVTTPGHDVTTPRSPDDHPPGHHVTAERTTEEEEQQGVQQREEDGASAAVITFDTFWEEYPKKIGKGDARGLWKKLSMKDRYDAVRGAQRHEWYMGNNPGVYVLPAADVWLRHRRWEDEEPRKPPPTERKPTQMDRVRAAREAKGFG